MKIFSVIFLQAFCLSSIIGGEVDEEFAEGNHEFTARVYKLLRSSEKGSLFFSPLSAEVALALVAEGAKGTTKSQLLTGVSLPKSEGQTASAIQSITPLLKQSKDNFKLLSANKLFVAKNYPIVDKFKTTAVEVYGADTENVNFAESTQSAHVINDWVEKQTNNKIHELISADQLDSDTRLVVVNALYLSAEWDTQFESYATKKAPFYTTPEKTEQVDMMHLDVTAKFKHCGYLQAKFLELPLKNSNVSITFIIPLEKNDIARVEKNLGEFIKTEGLKFERVAVSLPRFLTETKIDFKPILEKLGVDKLFTKEADLSGISTVEELFVKFVVQKAFINVTESGVEAAAATGVGITTESALSPPTISFEANHPFIYYIKEKTSGLILFIGKFQN